MKAFLREFKEFALRGNVMNLAVGVLIGSAFQSVVTSLTENILSPVIGLFTGQNFDSLSIHVMGIELKYGAFITSIINFIIIALVVFLLVKAMNRILSFGKKEESAAETVTRSCPFCMSEVHPQATRCPHCTAQLTAQAD